MNEASVAPDLLKRGRPTVLLRGLSLSQQPPRASSGPDWLWTDSRVLTGRPEGRGFGEQHPHVTSGLWDVGEAGDSQAT